MSDAGLILVALGTFATTAGVLLLLWLAKMITRATGQGLTVRFIPFRFRAQQVDLGNVEMVTATDCSPLTQYGGWGVRCGLTGKACNVSGSRGVLLAFKNGKTLMIGSQRADELAQAIVQARLATIGAEGWRGRGVEG